MKLATLKKCRELGLPKPENLSEFSKVACSFHTQFERYSSERNYLAESAWAGSGGVVCIVPKDKKYIKKVDSFIDSCGNKNIIFDRDGVYEKSIIFVQGSFEVLFVRIDGAIIFLIKSAKEYDWNILATLFEDDSSKIYPHKLCGEHDKVNVAGVVAQILAIEHLIENGEFSLVNVEKNKYSSVHRLSVNPNPIPKSNDIHFVATHNRDEHLRVLRAAKWYKDGKVPEKESDLRIVYVSQCVVNRDYKKNLVSAN